MFGAFYLGEAYFGQPQVEEPAAVAGDVAIADAAAMSVILADGET